MEDRIEQSRQIDAIIEGEMSVPDAHEDVRTWFELTIYNLAMGIVDTPKSERQAKVDIIRSEYSNWSDDVLALARVLCKKFD